MLKKLVSLLSVLFVIVLILISQRISLFQVKSQSLSLENVSCVSSNDLLKKINFINQSIFLVSSSKFSSDLVKQYPCVRRVSIERRFPNKIVIHIIGRAPIAQVLVVSDIEQSLGNNLEATPSTQSAFSQEATSLNQASSSTKLLIDKDGYLFRGTDSNNLQQFFLIGENLREGQNINQNITQIALQVLQKIKDLSLPIVKTPVIKENQIYVPSVKPDSIFFLLNSDFDKELASLQLLLQKSKMDQEQIDMIDLRFKNPIVVYSKKE